MPKNDILDSLITIRRRNEQRMYVAPPKFKINDVDSCGTCTNFKADRCKLKHKPVKSYNICEKHNQEPIKQ